MIRWHPNAHRQIFKAKGKEWAGGSGNRRLVLHTTETTGWPRYGAPPHLTLNPFTGELRQHVPFDRAAYAIRSNALEDDRFVWQVELIGRAANTPTYPDSWYRNVAGLVRWFVEHMGVPHEYADFSTMGYGRYAPQRMNQSEWDRFEGICGHAHVGRGVDVHWDPGMLDVRRLRKMVGGTVTLPPRPPDDEGEYEMRTIRKGDGMGDRKRLRPTVKAAQVMLATHGYADSRSTDGSCAADGMFGSGTDRAVRAFQTAHGLFADGVVGAKTWRALEG